MTGLLGLAAFDGPLPPELARAAPLMAHNLAHRNGGRPGAGLQPVPGLIMYSLDSEGPVRLGSWVGTASGVVYNQADIGAVPGQDRSPTLTATLLAWHQARGLSGLAVLNGDIALALADLDRNEVLLIRDHFGVQPLYYTRLPGAWAWASEIKAFFAAPGFVPEADPATLHDFLATHYRYIHQDPGRTYFKGVRQVPAGHLVRLNRAGATIERYWDLTLDPEVATLTPDEASQRLQELLTASVARRLPDGGAAFSISSGLDSSSVAALADRLTDRPPELYSVGYGGGEHDETNGISSLARSLGGPWHHLELTSPPLLDTIGELVRVHDGPLCTVTWLAHYFLVRTAAAHGRKILFSGLGGDENLSGEYEHFLYYFADLKAAGQEERLAAEVAGWMRLHDHPVFRKSWSLVDDAFSRLVDFDRPGHIHLDEKRFTAQRTWFTEDFAALGRRPEMPSPFASYLANRAYQDLFLETTPPCLAADGSSAARFGMTTRFPFLDHHLVRFCFSLPGTVKYDRGLTKAVLRRAMKGILPESSRTNPVKTGFNAPLGLWLAGSARDEVADLLSSSVCQERGWFKPGAIERLWAEQLAGTANHAMLLWQVLNAELWMRELTAVRTEAGK